MNMADRIQYLRKAKGISQEELADKAGVSRQAVSKWESAQSLPDIDKVIVLSEYFDVTTDYLLKGTERLTGRQAKGGELASKILYTASTAFLAIGLFCAFGGWYEKQTMESVWGAMLIQVVGIAGYFIARSLSEEKAPFAVNWLNVMLVCFMPVSMAAGGLSQWLFHRGWGVAPYPMDPWHSIAFLVPYAAIAAVSLIALKKQKK